MCRSGRPRRECGSCWRGVHGNRGVAESQLIAQASRLAADRGEAWFIVVFKQSVTELYSAPSAELLQCSYSCRSE
eukprot:scaffold54337_cov81-Phaeocystis_antarctica.AAC.1